MNGPTRLAACVAAVALLAASARGADSPRIGVLAIGDDAETADVRAGLVDGLRLAGLGATVERAGDAAEADAALAELKSQGVEVVVAVGGTASALAQRAVRSLPLVCVAIDDGDVPGFRERGGNACVAAGLPSEAVAAELRQTVTGLRRLGVFVPAGDAAALRAAKAIGGEFETLAAEASGSTPEERAASAAAQFVPGTDAIWAPPSVPAADVAALAQALAGRGVPLLGSRRAHLDAGCAVVVRSDARDLGALGAVLAKQVLAGADPARVPVRRPTRRIVDVNLPAAQRLGFAVQLTLLARADSVVRPYAVRR